MKIVIQNVSNYSFWSEESNWTGDLNRARDFSTVALAHRFCREQSFQQVQVVVKFENIPDLVFRTPSSA